MGNMDKDRETPRLPSIPTPKQQAPLKLVKLNGRYNNAFAGEIIGVSEDEAAYLLTERFPKDHEKRGQTYAILPSEAEHKQISDLKAWQEANDQRAHAEAMKSQAGILALALGKK